MQKLDEILENFALKHTFNNYAIIEDSRYSINRENITQKLSIEGRGGLCYDLNPLLYLELSDAGYNVKLLRASTFNIETNSYYKDLKTHIVILLSFNNRLYLIDSGYGANLPLTPVGFDGDIYSSRVGDFRIENFINDRGSHHLMMNLRHKNSDFELGYSLFLDDVIVDFDSELSIIEEIIATKSHFKDAPLYIKNTPNGHITITANSMTVVENYKVSKLVDFHPLFGSFFPH